MMSSQGDQRLSHRLSQVGTRLWVLLTVLVLLAIGVGAWYLRPAPERPSRAVASTVADTGQGEHEHTNHLIDETSPYLLQHAHNPVNWHPWGEAAFEKAKQEDKPIFLSVGYSTCYWCHVMEKESFEDEEVAKILNEHYIAIKVDREERPDVDEQYMLATQLITRRGGWPNSVWLTPEGKPWMAGTYFPKQRFMTILDQLATMWNDRRDEVEQQADQLAEAIARVSAGPSGGGDANSQVALNQQMLTQATGQLRGRYDAENAGFGSAPKFPPHGTLRLLIERYRATGEEKLLEPITHTLDAMWLGGMHDHVGGGFHRYSTDADWLLPHFEKMLYDNAQLMRLYTDGYRLTERERYRRAVADILTWVQREMTGEHGAFYSAIDSGEVGKEGETYVWHIDEVREVLGEPDASLFIDLYNIQKHGNFTEEATGEKPGTNIPHLDQPLADSAAEHDVDAAPFIERIATMRRKLLEERQTWPQPHKDDKVLSSWNGLMIGSLAYAGRQLDEPQYTQAAERAADFILTTMTRDDGTLLRTYRAGVAKQPGYLDDYAYLGRGLIELHRATGEPRWLDEAERLARRMIDDFQDDQAGGFYFTGDDHEDLLVRSKGLGGGGNVPNANGVAAEMLLDLAALTGKAEYRQVARQTLKALAPNMARQPFSSESLLIAADQALRMDDDDRATATGDGDGDDHPADAQAASKTPAGSRSKAASQSDEPRQSDGKAALTRRVEPVDIQVHVPDLTVKPGDQFPVIVVLNIDDGWHLYGKSPNIDFLVPSNVSITAPKGVKVGAVQRPEPHRMTDPILEKELNTYTGEFRFRVPITVASDIDRESVVLTLTVDTQACDDSRCLPPESTELRLPLAVAR